MIGDIVPRWRWTLLDVGGDWVYLMFSFVCLSFYLWRMETYLFCVCAYTNVSFREAMAVYDMYCMYVSNADYGKCRCWIRAGGLGRYGTEEIKRD